MMAFFTTTGVFNERIVCGLAWDETLQARMLGAALMLPTARPYGLWRDRVMQHCSGTPASRLLHESAALVTFQVPLYVAVIAASGASGMELVRGAAVATAVMLACGRPYGAFLAWVRRCFGV
ncbi:MAG: L-alanine exporter AlaE [Stenotrophomonas maltophilia]|uniref:L-alanine exporter AlaE n=1 Tax=Stenotrophomonas maltophilia TaxID=40324 RepID=A0A7V8FGW6_STEMA|nr:MAG: L-alanine exporter AlaE [Stenotrophomonas maltophilia]